MRRTLPFLPLVVAMVGCADGVTDPTTTGHAAIRAALLIDPENLPRYAGATLGLVLLYERQLSRNGTVSCATCHAQTVAFLRTLTAETLAVDSRFSDPFRR